jgi:hypothetical protein
LLVYSGSVARAQSSSPDAPATTPESKRLLGIVPNYRASPSLQNYQPLSPGDKFKIASEDAFDRGTVILAGIFGAEAQATNANRANKLGVQIGVDMAANILKEFWPDLQRKFRRRR